jgi:hypothetical protein
MHLFQKYKSVPRMQILIILVATQNLKIWGYVFKINLGQIILLKFTELYKDNFKQKDCRILISSKSFKN